MSFELISTPLVSKSVSSTSIPATGFWSIRVPSLATPESRSKMESCSACGRQKRRQSPVTCGARFARSRDWLYRRDREGGTSSQRPTGR
jgi:hypothetical protein